MKSTKIFNNQIKEELKCEEVKLKSGFAGHEVNNENIIDDINSLMIYFPTSRGRNIDTLDTDAHEFARIALKTLTDRFHKSPERVGLIGDIDTLNYFIAGIIQNYMTFLVMRDNPSLL